MGSAGADKIPTIVDADSSEANIEIKIKTLDSQTYTMRVDKQMPVPALKEQIASLTGVLSEQQRLICRGKVLKDDQLLSAYHVEDGHTLHLVVRQPLPPSESLPNHPATDPASGTSRGHVAPSVVIETFSVPEQGDGVPPEISRIVSAVLGSFGFSNFGSGSEGVDVAREHVLRRTSSASSTVDPSQLQPSQAGIRSQSERSQSAFGLPSAISLGSLHPPVIPNSMTTLSQYLDHMKREFEAIGRGENNDQTESTNRTEQMDSILASQLASEHERLPTAGSLAEIMLSSRQFLIEQVADCLLQLARQLEGQANVSDAAARLRTQSSAWRTGVQLHNLGAFLLELGRTTMTLRLGQEPSEAIVNAGPAVFINQSGPNPLMVQPLPFQPGSSFGGIAMGSVQPGSGLVNGIGTGFLPRRIDIEIRRGSSTATPNNNGEECGQSQLADGQTNPASVSGSESFANQTASRVTESSHFAAGSGVRVVPIRTMVAAVPGPFSRIPSDSSGNSIGLYHPVVSGFQPVATGQAIGGQGSQGSDEPQPSGIQNEQQSTPVPAIQQPNVEYRMRDGPVPPSNLRQDPSVSRSRNISIMSAGGTHNNQESERRIPSSVMQLLRTLFPADEIHVEDANLQGTSNSVPENAGATIAPMVPESRATDEGIFLSTLLREILPIISQNESAEPNGTPLGEVQNSESRQPEESSTQAECSDTEMSRPYTDTEPGPPNSKRQKVNPGWVDFLKAPRSSCGRGTQYIALHLSIPEGMLHKIDPSFSTQDLNMAEY